LPEVPFSRCVAIAGATGHIGGSLAPRLIVDGYSVRCLVRSPKKLEGRAWAANPGVEIRQVDLANAGSLAGNLSGCAAAYYLVHSITSAGVGYADKDRQLALQFASAARDACVGRIVYLGGLGETGADLSEHLSSRREVEAALASSCLPVTVLRAAMIIGSGSASFEIMRYLVERLPVMITPKRVSTQCQLIAVRNVVGTEDAAGGEVGIPPGFGLSSCAKGELRTLLSRAGARKGRMTCISLFRVTSR